MGSKGVFLSHFFGFPFFSRIFFLPFFFSFRRSFCSFVSSIFFPLERRKKKKDVAFGQAGSGHTLRGPCLLYPFGRA